MALYLVNIFYELAALYVINISNKIMTFVGTFFIRSYSVLFSIVMEYIWSRHSVLFWAFALIEAVYGTLLDKNRNVGFYPNVVWMMFFICVVLSVVTGVWCLSVVTSVWCLSMITVVWRLSVVTGVWCLSVITGVRFVSDYSCVVFVSSYRCVLSVITGVWCLWVITGVWCLSVVTGVWCFSSHCLRTG